MAEKRKFTQQEQVRRQKLEELANLGIDPFGQKYDVETYTSDIRREYGSCTKEELEEKKVSVQIAGRIIRRRRKGKVCFMDLLDRDGSIQLYVRKDVVGEEIYEIVKRGDLGDIIGVKGELMVTDMGELTVRVDEYTHLSKALRPLPEKFHGLTDTEERFRRRYVDLIMNEEARKVAFTRPKIIRSIQNYLDSKHFV
jgi:lysyl-tRNA synthetase class 2